jgi:hypothetical protein
METNFPKVAIGVIAVDAVNAGLLVCKNCGSKTVQVALTVHHGGSP